MARTYCELCDGGSIVWVRPESLKLPHEYDLSGASGEKVDRLAKAFSSVRDPSDPFLSGGFDRSEPPLIGYPIDPGVQLLDGGHRALAAIKAGLGYIPVWLVKDENSPLPMERSVQDFMACMRGQHPEV